MLRKLFLTIVMVCVPIIANSGPFKSDKVTIQTYAVGAPSLPELRTQMRRLGPNGYWAYTKTNWRWDGQCNMTFTATITMPELTDRFLLDAAELAEWDRMIAALRAHEDQHVEIGRGWAAAIKATGCDASKLDAINAKWRAREQAFDRDTDHGATLGVTLGF